MAVYKDKNRGTWYASVLYVDWTGKRCRKLKRGFAQRKKHRNTIQTKIYFSSSKILVSRINNYTKKSLKPHGLSDFFFKDFWMPV